MLTSPPIRDANPQTCTESYTDEVVAELDQTSRKGSASILVVDDQSVNLRVAEAFLRDDGYQHIALCDRPEHVGAMIARHNPDVILLDIMMPRVSGIDVLRSLRASPDTRYVPVIVLTALTDGQTKARALQLGATDFLNKPLDALDLLPRVRNALVMRAHQQQLKRQAQELEQIVRKRTSELTWTQMRLIHCLARAAEHRNADTGRHAVRVGRYAQIIAEQLGRDRQWCESILLAAMLHDVGKIGVPDAILLKPGRLDPDEFRQMKEHCQYGKEIIDPVWRDDLISLLDLEISETAANSRLLDLAASIAATHHERWDGTGYPRGLAGEQIPIEGRITAVADVFDAIGSVRPYKPAFPLSQCREIISEGSGGHFDPQVVEAFLERFDEVANVREQLRD